MQKASKVTNQNKDRSNDGIRNVIPFHLLAHGLRFYFCFHLVYYQLINNYVSIILQLTKLTKIFFSVYGFLRLKRTLFSLFGTKSDYNMYQKQENNKEKVLQIIVPLLEQLLPNHDKSSIQINPLFSTTNQVFKVTLEKQNHYVFRFLSPLLDRVRESKIMIQLSDKNIIPKCYFASQTCRLDEFISNARHPNPKQILQNISIIKSIMAKLAELHRVELKEEEPTQIIVFKIFSSQKVKQYQDSEPHSSYNQHAFKKLKSELLGSLAQMKQWVSQHFSSEDPQKIKVCHNDLNNLNLFIRQNVGKETEAIFIDFEYIGYNFLAYDIANLLNETTFQYSGPSPGFINTGKITKQDVQLACKFYEDRYQGLEGDVLKMLVMVNYYWAFWSIMVAPSESFNALEHGFTRWSLVKHYLSLIG